MDENPNPARGSAPQPEPPIGDLIAKPATSSGLQRNVAAGLACTVPLVGGAVFLAIEKKDMFVRFYAMQSVFLGAAIFLVQVVITITQYIFGMLSFVGKVLIVLLSVVHALFSLVWLVAYVITIIQAFSNKEWEIPLLGKLARKQLGETPAV